MQQALKKVNNTIENTSNELKIVEKLLKLDPGNVVLLAQKQKLLTDAIAATEEKLDKLKTAQEQAVKQLERGEIGEDQYRALERQIISTEQRLNGYRSELRSVERGAESAADSTEEMAEATEDAGDEMKKMSTAAKVAFAAAGAAIAKAGSQMVSFLMDTVEGTKELRTDMAKLEQNAKNAGTTFEDVSDELDYFVAVTDQSDSSVEALSNLLQAGFKKEGLTEAVENLAGAVIKFPDTLNIESLADSIQETLATGTATGQYGELLERLGVNLEEFEAGLAKCTTAAEKQEYAIDILAKNGLADISAEYKEANKNLIEYSNAQQHYNETLAAIGEAVQPAMTAFTEIKATLLEGMIPALEEAGTAIQEKMSSPEMQRNIQKIGEAVGDVAVAFADFAVFVIENADTIIQVIGSIAAGFAAWKITTMLTNAIKSFSTFATAVKNAGGVVTTAIKSIDSASLGTIIGVITTVIGLVVTLAGELGKATSETQQFADAANDAAELAKDEGEAFEYTSASIEAQGKLLKTTASDIVDFQDKIKTLSSQGRDASSEIDGLRDAVFQYNSIMGETALTIDENTGLVKEDTSALEENAEEWGKQKQAAAAIEELNRLRSENVTLSQEQVTVGKRLQDSISAENKILGDSLEGISDYYELAQKVSGVNLYGQSFGPDVDAAAEALNNVNSALSTNATKQEELQGWLEQNGINMENYSQIVNETGEVVQGLSDKEAERYINLIKNGQTLTEEQQKQLDAYKAANEEKTASLMELSESEAQYLITAQINGQTLDKNQQEMVDAYKEAHAEQAESYAELAQREKEINDTRVEQARQTESEIELNTETSLEKRTQTMLKNQETVKQAQDDYNKMMKHARDTGNKNLEAFLQQLDITSVEGMTILRQFATGSTDDINAFVDAWAEGANVGMHKVEGAVESGASTTRSTIQSEFSEGNARNDMYGLVEAGESTMHDLERGIENAQPGVERAMEYAIGHGRSNLYAYISQAQFANLGDKIDDEIARGIRRSASAITSAARSVASQVKSIFKFSVSVNRTYSGASIRSYDAGGFFTSPQVIEIAERRPEFVGAAEDLQTFIDASVKSAFSKLRTYPNLELPNVWGSRTGGRAASGGTQSAVGAGGITVNIDSFVNNTNQDVDTLTARVADSLQRQINRRRITWQG